MQCDICHCPHENLYTDCGLQVPDYRLDPGAFSRAVRIGKTLPLIKIDTICPQCLLALGDIIHNYADAVQRMKDAG